MFARAWHAPRTVPVRTAKRRAFATRCRDNTSAHPGQETPRKDLIVERPVTVLSAIWLDNSYGADVTEYVRSAPKLPFVVTAENASFGGDANDPHPFNPKTLMVLFLFDDDPNRTVNSRIVPEHSTCSFQPFPDNSGTG